MIPQISDKMRLRTKFFHPRRMKELALSDLELKDALEQARILDPYALGQLHDHYYPLVNRYIRFRMEDDGACEQICDQVFQHLVHTLRKQRGAPEHIPAWLFRTAAISVDEQLRTGARSKKKQGSEPAVTTEIASRQPGQDEIAWLGRLTRRALAQLPANQQHILALRFSADRSLDEIAAIAGTTIAEVKYLQFEGLSTMRHLLEKMD
jgi:RNA polymerase sigma-70 factor, ECF subfamily